MLGISEDIFFKAERIQLFHYCSRGLTSDGIGMGIVDAGKAGWGKLKTIEFNSSFVKFGRLIIIHDCRLD